VAVAFEAEDLGVVNESVDHGGDFVADDFAPAAEGLVAGDHQAGALVAPGTDGEVIDTCDIRNSDFPHLGEREKLHNAAHYEMVPRERLGIQVWKLSDFKPDPRTAR
jgi:hypothetical protein